MGNEGNQSPFTKLFEVTSDVFAGSITIPMGELHGMATSQSDSIVQIQRQAAG